MGTKFLKYFPRQASLWKRITPYRQRLEGMRRFGNTKMYCAYVLPDNYDLLTYIGNQLMDFALNLDRAEHELVAALVRQERWAQQHLYEHHYGKMMGVCMRYAGSRDEALDLLHEGFIKIFQNIGRYKPGTSLPAWIRTIIVNTCIDYYRRNTRRRTEDIDEAYQLYDDVPDALSNLTEKEILAAVQELSPAYRAVFNLYVVEGYSHKEIGDALHITESTSRSNLVKARIKLQEYFANKRMEFEINSDEKPQ